jgi:hypothetical protein
MRKTSMPVVRARPNPVDFWLPLLHRGVTVRATVNVGVMNFLIHEAGIDPKYIAKRIGSVFLDGCPVDDLERAMITEGCHLALGMAAPGLAGTSLNRGSPLAGFRADISYHPGQGHEQPAPGTFTLKLFNLVALEAAVSILRLGFVVTGKELTKAWARGPQKFLACVDRVELEGKAIAPAQAAEIFKSDDLIRVVLA